MFYGKEEIKFFLNCEDTKAYQVIREMANDLVKAGYSRPPHGKIQKKVFCEKFLLDIDTCEKKYQQFMKKKNNGRVVQSEVRPYIRKE